MPQAHVDPDELERFARNLKHFNNEVIDRVASLRSDFTKLGETWHDQEQSRFSTEFQHTIQELRRFTHLAEVHISFLVRKAQRAKTYLSLRVSSDKGNKSYFLVAGSQGAFSMLDWTGYPSEIPKPSGPFRLLAKEEYNTARHEGNVAIRLFHEAHPEYKDKEIHHIHPIKFGGATTDPNNFLPLSSREHLILTLWWNRLQRELEKAEGS